MKVGGFDAFYQTPVPPGEIALDKVVQMMASVPDAEWFDAYKKMLAPLPPGAYELIVHLAHDGPEMQGVTEGFSDWGSHWRQNDFDMIQSKEFQQFLKDQHFVLIAWKDLDKLLPADYRSAESK